VSLFYKSYAKLSFPCDLAETTLYLRYTIHILVFLKYNDDFPLFISCLIIYETW